MHTSAKAFIGLELGDRLRIVDLIEERPCAFFFRGEVLAMSRAVGNCTITVYQPSPRTDPDDLVSELRTLSKQVSNPYFYSAQQVGVVRSGEFSGLVYSTGEPILTTLSLEIAGDRLLGSEEGEHIVSQAGRGLVAFHEADIIHGRVRPYHILKTVDGWKIDGFAMNSLEDRLQRLHRSVREPAFLPPENYKFNLYGTPVDAWALGICLHLAACGRLPYDQDADLMEQILKNPPRVERAPGRVGTVIKGLLLPEVEERWTLSRSIDHIERPRDSAFQTGQGGGQAPAVSGLPSQTGVQQVTKDVQPVKAAVPDRPLFLRPVFLFLCTLVFALGTVVGFQTGVLPNIPAHNAPPEPLYSVDFSHTQIDSDGRVITRRPEQAVAYAETLGPDNQLEMVQIPSGVYEMGSTVDEPYSTKDERPRHRVQVSGFFISRYEITQQQWRAVASLPPVSYELKAQPATFVGEDRPVENITWLEAKEFCARLSRATGRLYRLPTEAEWEFACRAGTDTPFCFGETINSNLANYQADKTYAQEGVGEYRRETLAVGALGAANYFGLLDVHGNVAEWCEDIFAPYGPDFIIDPTGPKQGRNRVVRGGSWRSYPWQCRSAARLGIHEATARNDIGFRVVLPRVVMVPPPRN